MGDVSTNEITLSYAIEAALGTLPGSPTWYELEPNAINDFGAVITKAERNPISRQRQRRKGIITDLDSTVNFDVDLTITHFLNFLEGFVYAQLVGPSVYSPTAVTGTSYTVASGGNLTENTLVYARGFTISGNNGLKPVGSGSTGTAVNAAGLTAEASPPTNAALEIAGVRGATGDIEINASGNIASTTLDFTTLNLTIGQTIWVGGVETANRFDTVANRGLVRLTGITANELVIDKKSSTFVTDAGAGKTIDLYFGRFCRNVATDAADFLEQSYQFEATFPNLGNPSGTRYQYSLGNYANELTFNLPLTALSTMSFGFVGTDTQDPTATRETNAANAILPVSTDGFGTSSDIMRLRVQEVDETGLTTDFKSVTLTLNNNVSAEKVLARLGARHLNLGNFNVDLECQVLFTNEEVISAIRNNDRVTMDFMLRNTDGGIHIDIPSMTLDGGAREFPQNETVLLNFTGQAYIDPVLGTSIGVSLFPFVPAS